METISILQVFVLFVLLIQTASWFMVKLGDRLYSAPMAVRVVPVSELERLILCRVMTDRRSERRERRGRESFESFLIAA